MKRYELEMMPAREGEWVSFEDAAKKIHRLNNDLTSVTLERDALKRQLDNAINELTRALTGTTP